MTRGVLIADAVWDVLLGVGFLVLLWLGFPWFLAVPLAIGCFAFAALLVKAARGSDTAAITRLAAVSNAVTAVAGVIAAVVAAVPMLSVAAAVCAIFAGAEWRLVHTAAFNTR
jgi:hypothetical protein